MSHAKGTYLGGIRTLEALRVRCVCDPDTRCWHWRGAFQRSAGRAAEPRVWLAAENKTTTIMRAAWQLHKGEPIPAGKTVWRRCRSADCGNPAHLMVGTKAEWGAWVERKGYMRGRPERAAINRRIKLESGQARLTMELAQWVRESQQTGRAVAQALGVSAQVVSRVRTGQHYAPAMVASVFSWRPQA